MTERLMTERLMTARRVTERRVLAGAPGCSSRSTGEGVAGLRAHRSHEVIDIGDCLIAHDAIRELDIPGHDWSGAAAVEAAAGSADVPDNVAVTVISGGAPAKAASAREQESARRRAAARSQAHPRRGPAVPGGARGGPHLAGRAGRLLAGPPGCRRHAVRGRRRGAAAAGRRHGRRPVLRRGTVRRRGRAARRRGRRGDGNRVRPGRGQERQAEPEPTIRGRSSARRTSPRRRRTATCRTPGWSSPTRRGPAWPAS